MGIKRDVRVKVSTNECRAIVARPVGRARTCHHKLGTQNLTKRFKLGKDRHRCRSRDSLRIGILSNCSIFRNRASGCANARGESGTSVAKLKYTTMSLESQLTPLVQALKRGKKVTFFVGAGISTSCGIPDFRSPNTGLYANLQRLRLPYPEAVFDIDFFRQDPTAFYTLCEELYPGKFRPSKLHYLMRLLQENHQLARVYTQNIDTLESIAGVLQDKIVAAHGSFAANHCIDCRTEMEVETFKLLMENKTKNRGVPVCGECGGYVKPDIVFFGEGLPARFFDTWDDDGDLVEIAIVAGTSLTVHPFASLPGELGKEAMRVLINNEVVGDFKHGKRKSDVILKHDCDAVATALATQMGWKHNLDALVAEDQSTQPPVENNDKGFEAALKPKQEKPLLSSAPALEAKREGSEVEHSKVEHSECEHSQVEQSKVQQSESKEDKENETLTTKLAGLSMGN